MSSCKSDTYAKFLQLAPAPTPRALGRTRTTHRYSIPKHDSQILLDNRHAPFMHYVMHLLGLGLVLEAGELLWAKIR